jgi:hypothetical protein
MWEAWTGFVVLAINPFGGLIFAIPYAKAVLDLSPWLAAVIGWPLAYAQVVVVDVFWVGLNECEWFHRLVERKRTPRLEHMASSKYLFWLIAAFGAVIGPWLVMAVMRWARVPHRRIAAPLSISLGWNAALIAFLTVYAPRLLPAR